MGSIRLMITVATYMNVDMYSVREGLKNIRAESQGRETPGMRHDARTLRIPAVRVADEGRRAGRHGGATSVPLRTAPRT